MKYILILMFFIFSHIKSQHTISNTSYMLSPVIINPAFVGNDGALSIGLISRIEQWGTQSSNPISNTLFGHTPLVNKNIGIGGIVNYNIFGPQNNFSGKFIASGKFKVGKFRISIAGSAGYSNQVLSFTNSKGNPISIEEANTDPSLINRNVVNKFTLGLGTNVQYKMFFLGAYIPAINLNSLNESQIQKDFFYNQIQVFGGANIRILDELVLKPSILLRNLKGSGIQPDFNLLINLFDNYTIGASYKVNNAISGIVMLNLTRQFSIVYAYDYIMNTNLGTNSKGNHELQLKYIFKFYVNDMNVKRFK